MVAVSKELSITINSAHEGVVWEGSAESLSSKNSQGSFDVLPRHANFITIIDNTAIQIRKRKEVIKEITPQKAVLYIREGEVNIYTDI